MKKKKKHKNGIWFNSTASIEQFSIEKAERLQSILENVIFYAITVPIQLIQTLGVMLIAFFNDAFLPFSFFLMGFFFTRSFLGETFHFNSTVVCTTVTWLLFYLITYFIPSIYISVFLSLMLGVFVSVYMNYIVTKDCDS